MVYQFWIVFAILAFLILFFDRKYGMLRDISTLTPRPYSWSRVQLAWWTVIILSSFVAIFILNDTTPTLHQSTLILLSISVGTTAAARVIDVSDVNNPTVARHQDLADGSKRSNFLLDILSDKDGPSIHRFQAIVFNLVFGIWFIDTVLANLQKVPQSICDGLSGKDLELCKANAVDYIMPVISDNNLILLGLSTATYAALKITENSTPNNTGQPATANNPAANANPAANPNTAGNPNPDPNAVDDSNSGQHDR
jgi:hypothetical protein